MRRRRLKRWLLGSALVLTLVLAQAPAPARAQMMAPAPVPGFTAAPGYYGTTFGIPSYGTVATYTTFSSPYGGGYGYGYPAYGYLPGRYGVGLWRPGYVSPGYAYGAAPYGYGTFPVPYPRRGAPVVVTPSIGVYAPGFGPRTYRGW